jgi:hypothetical protein
MSELPSTLNRIALEKAAVVAYGEVVYPKDDGAQAAAERIIKAYLAAIPNSGEIPVATIHHNPACNLKYPCNCPRTYEAPKREVRPSEIRFDDGADEYLRQASECAYLSYIEKAKSTPCCGWEQKIKSGQFGQAEMDAHAKMNQLLGKHQAYADVRKALREPKREVGAEPETA